MGTRDQKKLALIKSFSTDLPIQYKTVVCPDRFWLLWCQPDDLFDERAATHFGYGDYPTI